MANQESTPFHKRGFWNNAKHAMESLINGGMSALTALMRYSAKFMKATPILPLPLLILEFAFLGYTLVKLWRNPELNTRTKLMMSFLIVASLALMATAILGPLVATGFAIGPILFVASLGCTILMSAAKAFLTIRAFRKADPATQKAMRLKMISALSQLATMTLLGASVSLFMLGFVPAVAPTMGVVSIVLLSAWAVFRVAKMVLKKTGVIGKPSAYEPISGDDPLSGGVDLTKGPAPGDVKDARNEHLSQAEKEAERMTEYMKQHFEEQEPEQDSPAPGSVSSDSTEEKDSDDDSSHHEAHR